MKEDRSWTPGQTDLDWIESLGRPVDATLAALEVVARPGAGIRIAGGPSTVGAVPIVDLESARLLRALASNRRRIVEVGTAIGYSTLWLALGQPADGTIVTIDPDTARTAIARDHWRAAGMADRRIRVVNRPALDAFQDDDPELAGPFDLAFIDAVKEEYTAYLDALIPRLAAGALVVADNVLWSGRTSGARPSEAGDGSAELRAFCERVLGDERFSGTILPLDDGLLVAAYRP